MEERNHVAAVKEEENIESRVFFPYKESEKSSKNIWYLDNCTSNHMCGREDLFSELDENIHGQVKFGDESHATVKEQGDNQSPPPSPIATTSTTSSSPTNSNTSNSEEAPTRMRSLTDIYKMKTNKEGKVEKYKARLVAKGYKQRYSVDYDEMDVKLALLNGYLEEEVYIEQAPEYSKQAPEYSKQGQEDKNNEFMKSPYEHALYMKKNEVGDIMIVCLYVDDMIFTGNNLGMFNEFKKAMTKEFGMTNISEMSYFLGVEVKQMKDGTFVSQKKYTKQILRKFSMKDCKPVATPAEPGMKLSVDSSREPVNPTLFKSIIRSLKYLTIMWPDIMYAVGIVSRYMEKPKQDHLIAAKRILRYIKGTMDQGLFYSHSQSSKLVCYLDSDYGGDLDDRKSTFEYLFHIGSATFSWSSKKQQTVDLSTCEAEYMAVATCTCQAI
ncbi:hypothetical protein CXB51_018820 [Gossypium anomalum]|uniref:Reverse transcriptase Ty1/copia-type domain-containing protein n=1 Tax=Gossypium anomalum TaxID=47600 RepID=A0A8J6CX77_9ROSI|nr:hypothetical protein CXB51_018820 [Gossypium anomalum]